VGGGGLVEAQLTVDGQRRWRHGTTLVVIVPTLSSRMGMDMPNPSNGDAEPVCTCPFFATIIELQSTQAPVAPLPKLSSKLCVRMMGIVMVCVPTGLNRTTQAKVVRAVCAIGKTGLLDLAVFAKTGVYVCLRWMHMVYVCISTFYRLFGDAVWAVIGCLRTYVGML